MRKGHLVWPFLFLNRHQRATRFYWHYERAISSAGRAAALQAAGRQFNPVIAQFRFFTSKTLES